MAPGEKEEKRGRSGLSAFLGMLLSGLLSIFIAFTMFMIGVIHQRISDDRERKALVQFLAVEAVDINAEACRSAYGVFLGNRHREMVAPKMAGARTLGQVISLDADPALVAAVRSIHGRYARVQRDVSTAYSFFQKKSKLTQNQIRKVIADCKGMGEEVREILKIAAAEGVDGKAISRLEETCAKADELTAALVKQKEKLLPDLKMSKEFIDMGVWSGRTLSGNSTGALKLDIHNYSDAPVTIAGTSFTLKGFKTRVPASLGKGEHKEMKPDKSLHYYIDHPRWPDQLPRGPFEETLTIETDCPGYERITIPVKGVAAHMEFKPDKLDRVSVRKDCTKRFEVFNCLPRTVTIRSATCSIAGAEATLPKGNKIEPMEQRSGAGYKKVDLHLKFVKDAMAPGPFEGTLTIETDCPGYESVKIPIKGTVE